MWKEILKTIKITIVGTTSVTCILIANEKFKEKQIKK